MVLLMYISKRVENRSLFASTGLMTLLLSYAVSEKRRKGLAGQVAIWRTT